MVVADIAERIIGFPLFFLKLFFSKKFIVHRLVGLLYLIQFFAALYIYFTDYEYFYNSILVWSLPFSGFAQSIIATMTFSFLPKKQDDPGYNSDKSVLSYAFVKENIYFSGILLFQWLYMHETYRSYINDYIPFAIESTFVFLPYVLVRPLFPKTSFRDSLAASGKNKSDENRTFFVITTWVTKVFYVWAKHFIGFFLNYARFLDRISPEFIRHIYLMLIMSSCATTIAMFLHTLKFKKIIGPKTAYILYMMSYLATFYSWLLIINVFFQSPDLLLMTLTGVVVNFLPSSAHTLYQSTLAVVFNAHRMGNLPAALSNVIFISATAAAK